MLSTTFSLDNNGSKPLYLQLAEQFKKEIRLNHIAGDTRLPSIRKLAAALNLSRTTVETAYGLLLAEGYIMSQPKRGYIALNLSELPTVTSAIPPKKAKHIELFDKLDCCGCSACADKCPTNSISMKPDEEGFLYPEIDKSKCVEFRN